jgi:hypothetical protein
MILGAVKKHGPAASIVFFSTVLWVSMIPLWILLGTVVKDDGQSLGLGILMLLLELTSFLVSIVTSFVFVLTPINWRTRSDQYWVILAIFMFDLLLVFWLYGVNTH